MARSSSQSTSTDGTSTLPSRQRSKLTNGVDLLPASTGACPGPEDLEPDPRAHPRSRRPANVSAGDKYLIRRCAALNCELELLEHQFAANGSDLPSFGGLPTRIQLPAPNFASSGTATPIPRCDPQLRRPDAPGPGEQVEISRNRRRTSLTLNSAKTVYAVASGLAPSLHHSFTLRVAAKLQISGQTSVSDELVHKIIDAALRDLLVTA